MDLKHVFRTGKYSGRTVQYVYSNDRRYFNWVLENRPEMLKSHNKEQPQNTQYKKPVYVDPPEIDTRDSGAITPLTPEEGSYF